MKKTQKTQKNTKIIKFLIPYINGKNEKLIKKSLFLKKTQKNTKIIKILIPYINGKMKN